MNGIEYIASILKQEGFEALTCFPNNPLIEAAAEVGIRPIMFRHERGAVTAADGFSRTSDRERFGVVALQSQAGAESAMGGVAQAYADNVPILVLPGGVRRDQIAVRPNFSAVHNYGGIVKRVEAIYEPGQVADVMRRAFHALKNGVPGPVVVELTADVCNQEAPADKQTCRSLKTHRSQPAAGEIADAAKALLAAEKAVIWAGAGVLFGGATAELRELAELTGIPVFCTMPGKSAMDERHPLSLGAGSGMTTLPAHEWLRRCDVMLCLGSSLTRTLYGQPVRLGKTLIQNTNNPDEINKDESVDIALIGDAKLTIIALLEHIKGQIGEDGVGDAGEARAQIAALRSRWLEQWRPLLQSNETPLIRKNSLVVPLAARQDH
ncbi:MAG: thiamine pyrophosphate-binding protein [Planctomycetota bacterium]|jgi:thiamine pyrophosphate-dependent acetolactate synthase large subunit-like protein